MFAFYPYIYIDMKILFSKKLKHIPGRSVTLFGPPVKSSVGGC